ncbi:MAG: hypothetical protein AAF567_02470 [Actinomycetota bacterium]
MPVFGKKAPELQRIDDARKALRRHGEPRPVIMHTVDKIEAAIDVALDDRRRIGDSLGDFDADRIAAELKTALRTKPRPTDPDDDRILSLRRRHEAVHALHNRRDEIHATIERTLADLDTFVAERAMALATSRSDGTFEDLSRWIDTLNDDAAHLSDTHAALDRSGGL